MYAGVPAPAAMSATGTSSQNNSPLRKLKKSMIVDHPVSRVE
jgi:hypothetical protein